MLMPSDTEIVVNSRGVPPASAIPALAASTWKSWVMLQGVCSPFMLTTPIIGLASAASSSPIARMKARWGARSRPSVVTRDRHFFMGTFSRGLNSKRSRSEPNWAFGHREEDSDEAIQEPWIQRTGLLRCARNDDCLLYRCHDRRVLELRDVHLRQHSRGGVDVEHLLDRIEIRRGSGIPAEIIVLEQIGIQHRDRRLQHFGVDLERFVAIGQRLFHTQGDIAHIGSYQMQG